MTVDSELGVIPVEKGIVEAYLDTFSAESVRKLTHKVASKGSIGDLVLGVLAVKEAESLVVLCREDGVLHSRLLCLFRPFLRIKQVGVKAIKVLFHVLVGNSLEISDPFVACKHRVKSEVDKHTESVMHEPVGVPRCGSSLIA